MISTTPELPTGSSLLPVWPQWRADQYAAILVLVVGIAFRVPAPDQSLVASTALPAVSVELLKPAAVPNLVASNSASITKLLNGVTAESFVVIDEDSAVPLVEKNATEKLYPASTTKLMTALVARDQFYLSQVVSVPPEAMVEGNTINLQVGQKISISSLLQGLLINSGNDAAYTLAYNHPNGFTAFIDAMNQQAADLHLSGTKFKNPAGFDDPEHLMTARDLALLFREVMKDPELRTIMGTVKSQSADVTGTIAQDLNNTNQLLSLDASVVAGKTGTTPLAGQVLVIQFERNNHPITIAVMKSQDRYTDTRLLIDWVMTEYEWRDLADSERP
jgi:D-alanyl-D-alanine carboxypeptidase